MKMLDGEVLTSDKTKFLDMKLEQYLNERGYSIEWLDTIIKTEIEKYGGRNRDSIVAVANILTEFLEDKFEIKIPYTFGGGHYFKCSKAVFPEANGDYDQVKNAGVNPNWGYNFTSDEQEKYTDPWNNKYPYFGPDCTGYIIALLRFLDVQPFNKNAANMRDGYTNEIRDELFLPIGKVSVFDKELLKTIPNKEIFDNYYSLYNDNVYMGQKGDLIHFPGHIMLITDVDEINGIFYTTESYGGIGVIKTKHYIHSLMKDGRYSLINLEELYLNPEKVLEKYSLFNFSEEKRKMR